MLLWLVLGTRLCPWLIPERNFCRGFAQKSDEDSAFGAAVAGRDVEAFGVLLAHRFHGGPTGRGGDGDGQGAPVARVRGAGDVAVALEPIQQLGGGRGGNREMLGDGAGGDDLAAIARDDQELQSQHVGFVELHVASGRFRERALGVAEVTERRHELGDLRHILRGNVGALDEFVIRVVCVDVVKIVVAHEVILPRNHIMLGLYLAKLTNISGGADVARRVLSRSGDESPRRPGALRFVRVAIPVVLIVVWLVAAGLGGPLFGKIDEVSSNDQTNYLPSSSEAAAVQRELEKFTDSDGIPAVVVFVADRELSPDAQEQISAAVESAADVAGVLPGASPALLSSDGLAMQAFVQVAADAELSETVPELTAQLRGEVPDSVAVYVTGPAGLSADLAAGFAGIDGLLLGAALAAVFVILILVYRSLLLPIAVLMTSLFALCVALLVVWWLAKAGVLLLSGQTQGILFILVIGAATDYALLLVSRFREELRLHRDKNVAVRAAWRGSVEPIAASGGTVIAGLLCLLLSDLKSNSALGPVAAIGIVFAMFSALTLLPALLSLLGRAAFWPRRPAFDPARSREDAEVPGSGPWHGLTGLIRRHSRALWVGTAVVLLAGCVGVVGLNASGVAQSELVLGSSQARDGQSALAEHFPAGAGSPVYVLVDADELNAASAVMLDNDGVDLVSVAASDSPSGSAPVTASDIGAVGPPGTPAPSPTEVDGKVLLQGTLVDEPDSDAAAVTVGSLRSELSGLGAQVGGVTATAVDTNAASIHDRNLIIPVTLLVILVILMLLLRSVLAPVLLIATTVLSFGTAMGVSALVFNGLFQFPGADPAVPLYGFVFLVALGIDYNIFLMTRVREESKEFGTRPGILRGVAITGGVITSAGVVLAATFAALAVIPILFLVQLAFIVAFGVLLDTFVVRTVLVPALSYDIGSAIWWPSKLARARHVRDDPKE